MNSAPQTQAETEKLLYKLVIQFLIFSQGKDKLLDPHLAQIGKRLRGGSSLHDLSPELHGLSKSLLAISKQSKSAPTTDANDYVNTSSQRNDYVMLRLEEFLVDMPVPTRMQPQKTSMEQKVKLKHSDQSYRSCVDSAISLLLNIRDYAMAEQKGIDSFMSDLASQLTQIEQQAELVSEANLLSIGNRDQFSTTISEHMGTIKDVAASADELTALKTHTTEHLDQLMQQLFEHKQREDVRQLDAQKQLESMTLKLQSLETETEALRTKLKIEHDRALSDSLTGLPNHSAYKDRMDSEYHRWKRYGAPLSLIVWDIDFFKRINDNYGHKAGDKTLMLVAQLLHNNCRESDFIARYGGEEFVMLLPNTQTSQALEMADKIRRLVQQSGFNSNGEDINLTLSGGISEFETGDQPDDVFIRADQALYLAKQQGRNQCVIAKISPHI